MYQRFVDDLINSLQSKNRIKDLISRADDYDETQRLIAKFHELKIARIPFYLDIHEFDKILLWKLRRQYYRQIHIREQNTDELVRAITQAAFALENVDKHYETKQRLKMLSKLHGVQIPVASAIMTLCYPELYSVIDFRGWRQVFGYVKESSTYSALEYILYLSIIRQVALHFDVTPQQVDMALWQSDIECKNRLC